MKSSKRSGDKSTENLPPSFKEVAEFLGMEVQHEVTGKDIADRVSMGFPKSSLDNLAQVLAPDDPEFKFSLMDAPGTESRHAEQRLLPRESGLVYRLTSV